MQRPGFDPYMVGKKVYQTGLKKKSVTSRQKIAIDQNTHLGLAIPFLTVQKGTLLPVAGTLLPVALSQSLNFRISVRKNSILSSSLIKD